MRRWVLIALLAGAGCTELGDESPFPHRDAPPASDAAPTDTEPDSEETTDAR